MQLVSGPVTSPDPALPEIALKAARLALAKRLWRGVAEDGTEFGFELGAPLKHGETFWQTATARYVVQQQPEAVLEISLEAVAPSAAAVRIRPLARRTPVFTSAGFDAAVVFLVFNRPELTARVFARIRDARPGRLFVVADGPRPRIKGEAEKCRQVRALIERRIDWPCELVRDYSEVNLGCGRRVASTSLTM